MAVKRMFNRLKFWKRGIDEADPHTDYSPEYRLANKLKRYEKYVSQLQHIIMWDNPAVSLLCVVSVNIIFWIFVSLEWRFYGILSSLLLVITGHEVWTGHVWPEISVPSVSDPPPDAPADPSLVAMSKLVTTCYACFSNFAAWLGNLRLQQPGVFCCLSCIACSILLLLGRSVSGLLLVYLLLMSAMLGPGLVLHVLPPQFKTTVAQYASCIHQAFLKYSVNEASDDEYVPETTSEDLALLTRASDLHHDTYDSLTNPGSSSDMASGLGQMPSHEEDSLGTLSDMEPAVSMLPLDPADDSDSNPGEHQIEFRSGHFNGDSSSSDEEAFAKDLVFSDADERDTTAHRGLSSLLTQAVASNVLGSVGLLANVMRQRQTILEYTDRHQTRRRADTDSDNEDFEIINRDELNSQDSS